MERLKRKLFGGSERVFFGTIEAVQVDLGPDVDFRGVETLGQAEDFGGRN